MRVDANGAAIRATMTHQVAGAAIGWPGDALAVAAGPGGAPVRLFVPGLLPCGECPACRRALCVACPNARLAFPSGGELVAELPERFLAIIEEQDQSLPATRLIAAGLVAEVIGGAARTGLGPGETAVWMGEAPWAAAGASWSARRGCRTFLLSATSPAPSPAAKRPEAEVGLLDPRLGPDGWRELIETAEAAGGPGGGRPERRIFIYGASRALTSAALSLAVPGATISFMRGAPPSIVGLDAVPLLRIFVGSSFHPDLVPEALAAIRRGEVDVENAFREVPLSESEAAVNDFRAGLDRRVPVVAF